MVVLTDPNRTKQRLFAATGKSSIRQLSVYLDVNRKTMGRAFSGKRVRAESIEPLARAIDCPTSEISEVSGLSEVK